MQIEEAQDRVALAVESRDYVSHRAEEHLVKAAVKMLEEACELVVLLPLEAKYIDSVREMEVKSRVLFDRLTRNGVPRAGRLSLVDLASELADVQVTVFDVADRLNALSVMPYYVAERAVRKAESDIERGVR